MDECFHDRVVGSAQGSRGRLGPLSLPPTDPRSRPHPSGHAPALKARTPLYPACPDAVRRNAQEGVESPSKRPCHQWRGHAAWVSLRRQLATERLLALVAEYIDSLIHVSTLRYDTGTQTGQRLRRPAYGHSGMWRPFCGCHAHMCFKKNRNNSMHEFPGVANTPMGNCATLSNNPPHSVHCLVAIIVSRFRCIAPFCTKLPSRERTCT